MVNNERTEECMNIFISYARKDKPFCNHFVGPLQKVFTVWYDGRLKGGQNWKKEIYRRLLWCDVFIYLLSPDSVESYPCQKELEVVLKLNRPIIPILINKDTQIPNSLSDLQYIDMSEGLTPENIAELLAVLMEVDRDLHASTKQTEDSLTMSEILVIVHKVQQALDGWKYEKASDLLKQIPMDVLSNSDELDSLIKVADKATEAMARLKAAKRLYNKSLSRYQNTRDYLLDSFETFSLNTLGNTEKAQSAEPTVSTHTFKEEDFIPQVPEQDLLPMLEWCNIPFGTVHVSSIANGESYGEKIIQVDNFVMGKFPITNAQFDVFLQVEDGYYNPQWWQFSEQAKTWFKTQKEPHPAKFLGDDLPRENVSWFEAMAFCNWLSILMNMKITLPNIAQWQRAAQGDDDRIYPWGDDYHKDHCNTRECGINKTTPVNQYSKGESMYGVYDMSGNVWEWALDKVAPNDEIPTVRHAVIGGSFVSTCDRAQIPFRYYLESRTRFSSIGFRVVGLT